MTRPRLLLAAFGTFIATVCASALAQSPAAKLSFDIASVKPNKSGEFGGSFGGRPGGQLVVRNNTLRNMIRNAYRLQDFQIVGGPAWIDSSPIASRLSCIGKRARSPSTRSSS